VLIADADGNTICSAETTTGCTIHKMRQNDLKNIYLRAVENGGKLEEKIKNFEKPDMMPAGGIKQDVNDNEERPTDIENIDKYDKLPNMPNENESESIIKVRVVETQSGETYVVFLNSVITPVGATVHTLRVQLIYISGIMILLSLLIALIISKRV